MNAVLGDEFFNTHLFGLLKADMDAFAQQTNRIISDDLCFALNALLCTEFRTRQYTLIASVPEYMRTGVPSDPRIRLAASRTIHAELRPRLAERLAQCTSVPRVQPAPLVTRRNARKRAR